MSLRETSSFNPQILAQAERELCSRFIVLNDVPIIVQLMKLFTKDIDMRQMYGSIYQAHKVLRAGRIQEHWRVLQTTTASQSLGADVTIVSSDNFSEYSGIGVSGHHPMDFSMSPQVGKISKN
eukprot:GABU01002241.1.p1 GENE.GABU01002241.1~~GABU01002241.1.p1  ORF type:complete len:134 (+),score=5.04 GABU01002241.1:36-404(+)